MLTIRIASGRPTRRSRVRATFITAILLASAVAHVAGQSVTVNAVNDILRVRVTGATFLRGDVLARLRDGQSVRVDLEMGVLLRSGGTAATQARQSFVLSYDLWEERFAVTQPGTPMRSISHLTSAAAETWCFEQLSVPLKTISSVTRETPFWIRLVYRFLDGDIAPDPDDAGFTLRSLIDALSRRRAPGEPSYSIEAGPFRLP